MVIVTQSLAIALLLQQNLSFRWDTLLLYAGLLLRTGIRSKVETSSNSAYGVLSLREDPV